MRSKPYDIYFGEMALTDEQKENRENMAGNFEECLLIFFAFIKANSVLGDNENTEYYCEMLTRRFIDVITDADLQSKDELIKYVGDISKEIVDTTIKNQDKEYYTSSDRAMYIAENEANTVYNDEEFNQAIKDGYTRKMWIAINDKHTRNSHSNAHGQVVEIYEPFEVGDSLMMFPKDTSLGADDDEIVNCRCCVAYLK